MASSVRTYTITRLALVSRLLCIALSFLSSFGLTDLVERTAIVVKDIDLRSFGDILITAHAQWDSLHFLNIATRGYDTVLAHAFLPGLPLIMRLLTYLVPFSEVDPVRSLALMGFIFVNVSFIVAAVGLYKLSCHVLKDESKAFRSSLFFIFTAASPFMSALYNESPFAMFTFWGLYWLVVRHDFLRGSLLLGAAGLFRSNGILAIIFLVWFGLIQNPSYIIETLLGSAFVYLPYHLYSTWSKNMYCEVASPPDWCATDSIYGYVQKTFWRVFPFGYYRLRNIPQFLLMSPALIVCVFALIYFFEDNSRQALNKAITSPSKSSLGAKILSMSRFLQCMIFESSETPYLGQLWILTLLTLFVANVNILTRLVVSCPIYFWTAERLTRESRRDSLVRFICGRIVFIAQMVFLVIGPVLHSAGYNWT